ncbi:protein-S-isoprenylcysteine O-methyltransferase-like [Penaeus japonicus]|uniref:protein-S-isoprenylcysteine O-methyltransferase-like n=1 Tax=Penaeus japonicus TaxID=27405 RepID=UPI001C71443F|nr:protein-S-isoprenylcysteine O-methyltransferase-like [Penaeus japonicus]
MISCFRMVHEGQISLQSFLLGLGILSYFLVTCGLWSPRLGVAEEWLQDHPWVYCGCFFASVNAVLALAFRGKTWQIAVRGCFLGSACGLGVMVSVLCSSSYHVFGWYMVVLTLFHYSEYITTAIGNPATLSLDSYLLNHSVAYGLAAVASWVEFFIERYFLPEMKTLWYLSTFGILVCLWGEIIRKAAMLTAKTNFNHIVQTERQKDHELVTWGAYSMFRHPSYVGWFWWSIGTQLILVNPVCTIAYALASWSFFYERIYFEEITLIKFFGEKYLDYQKKVSTGLPFIKGYQYVRRVRQESE